MRTLLAACAASFLGFAEARGQEDYHDPAQGWTVTIPAHWMQWPPEAVAAANAEMAKLKAGMPRAIAGLRREDSDSNGFPYVLVQVIEKQLGSASYEDIEKMIGAQGPMDDAAAEVVKTGALSSIAFETSRLDRATNRIFLSATLSLPDGTQGRSLSVMFLRKSGILQVNCYDKVADFAGHAAEFDAIVNSVRLDAGQAFVPGTGRGGVLSGAARGAVIGAVIGLVGGAIAWLKRKKAA